jgi:hypothetical protein
MSRDLQSQTKVEIFAPVALTICRTKKKTLTNIYDGPPTSSLHFCPCKILKIWWLFFKSKDISWNM